MADDWANYHQRLNRRYDSGYKSIENQLSSSLEGNVLAANSSLQSVVQPVPTGPPGLQQYDRPQSGCSAHPDRARAVNVSASANTADDETANSQQDISPRNTIDAKLGDLDLDDVPLDGLLGQLVDRDCQSRSSSSNEGDKKSD